MADDWDLFAVVRSCTNSSATATTAAASTSSTPARVSKREFVGDPFVNLPYTQRYDNPFYFPGVIDEKDDLFQGLEEIYKESYLDTRQTPKFSGSLPGEFQNQPKIQGPDQQEVQPRQSRQQNQDLPLRHAILGSSLSFPSTNPQPIRPRRRKNQQAKVVHQMTQEELSADSWAWRKYGQKPIKGSPFPRNYYRCSTSKGCPARKQVERSPSDPDIFVVSYSGEHTHPRPTHRSSLAGSTRSKLSPAAKTTSSSAPSMSMAAPTTSSPVSASSISPATHMMEGESECEGEENNTEEGPYIENDNGEMLRNIVEDEEEDDNDEEEDILIPNSFITDDILKGFQELNGGGTNCSDSSGAVVADNSSSSLFSPPWTPTSSIATTNNNFAAGGG